MTLPLATVLIVDDQPATLQQWTSLFEENGAQVIAVNNGFKAIEVCETILPDLILSDLDMPQMDGFELIKRIKDNTATQDIPIIICSGTTDVTSKFLCSTLGAAAYIDKPLSLEPLMNALEHSSKALPSVA